jgi:hypothetical protein
VVVVRWDGVLGAAGPGPSATRSRSGRVAGLRDRGHRGVHGRPRSYMVVLVRTWGCTPWPGHRRVRRARGKCGGGRGTGDRRKSIRALAAPRGGRGRPVGAATTPRSRSPPSRRAQGWPIRRRVRQRVPDHEEPLLRLPQRQVPGVSQGRGRPPSRRFQARGIGCRRAARRRCSTGHHLRCRFSRTGRGGPAQRRRPRSGNTLMQAADAGIAASAPDADARRDAACCLAECVDQPAARGATVSARPDAHESPSPCGRSTWPGWARSAEARGRHGIHIMWR